MNQPTNNNLPDMNDYTNQEIGEAVKTALYEVGLQTMDFSSTEGEVVWKFMRELAAYMTYMRDAK